MSGLAARIDWLSPWILIPGVYAVASTVTFVAYGLDKRRAAREKPRIAERTLHVLELCGGWPGALVGMRAFRHKTAKTSFRLVTYTIAALHAVAWVLYLTNGRAEP